MKLVLPFGSEIPDRYTQFGQNLSPEVNIEEIPEETKSIVLTMEDLNAGMASETHWIVWNIPPNTTLQEDLPKKPVLENGVCQGNNDFGVIGYTGPESIPQGEKYCFTAYALETELNLEDGSMKEQVREAMRGKVMDKCSKEVGYTN